MQDSASRRRVLKNMAAFGAAGTVSIAFASEGQHPRQFAQVVVYGERGLLRLERMPRTAPLRASR
jgi:hypothetical protein